MIGLAHYLTLAGVLFAIAVAGVFLNRRNVILLLMCIELMLLAVNFNFIAFAHELGDLGGQVFVFFILTVAAAEAAIGLAILVVLFRNRRSIDVDDLDLYYTDCVIGGPGAFMIPVNDWEQFPEAIRRKLVLELAGADAPIWVSGDDDGPPVVLAQDRPRYDCLAGEKLWRDRSWMWDSR